MKRPFSLIPATGSSDTARCVEALATGVRDRKVIGLAYVVLYKSREFEAHLCGEAERSPVFTDGCVGALRRKLGRLIDGDD